MTDQALQATQARLEEKRASLKQTDPEQISCLDIPIVTDPPNSCPDCGLPMRQVERFLGHKVFLFCDPCSENEEIKCKAEADEQAKKARVLQQLSACNIGDRFKGMIFSDYKPTCEKAAKILSECQNYVDNFQEGSGANILMIGSPGTGKNMLAAIIGQEIIKRDFHFLHTTAIKLVRRVKDTWRNKEESEQAVIDSFAAPSLLVIDEIGVQFGTPTEQLFLTEVINERYEKRRPTILVSNLKLSQITEVMGERVIDRFYDDGSKFLIFDWSSYRRNKPVESRTDSTTTERKEQCT